jgi:ankyrin repeat protein
MAKTKFADIFEAAEKGTVEDVRCFIKEKDANIDAKGKGGATPLILAASNGNIEVVKFLVSKGADVNVRDNVRDNTPLSDAAFSGNLTVVEFLVSKGANVNTKNDEGCTPLIRTLWSENLTVAEFLVSKGANVDAKDNKGWTLLHIAADNHSWLLNKSSLKFVEFAVSKGADVNARNNKGSTPLHRAAAIDNPAIAKFLVSKGADVNAKNNEGYTPLNYTKSMSKTEDYLKSVGGVETEVNKPTGGGCYIATAVYNSYDAPEVLCLRRFRDEVLTTSILGRLFITLYYRFSPPVAERLKRTRHINLVVRKALDKIVGRLNKRRFN